MAQEVDLKPVYDLAFAPLSADVHGEWSSLKTTYLQRCLNPLHRYHYLPLLETKLPFTGDIVIHMAGALAKAITVWGNFYGMDPVAQDVDTFLAEAEALVEALKG